jgi:hypothetical protein
MHDNKLYKYSTEIDLVYTAYGLEVDNRNMNPRHVVVHRGLTNTIYFNIRDRDRRLQTITTDQIRCYVIDPTTRRRVVSKLLTPDLLEKGIAKLSLLEGDIINLVPGLYHCYFTITRDESHEEPLYSNQKNDIAFTIEVTDQAYSYPIPTQEANANILISNSGNANVYATSNLTGNLDRNFLNGQHTMAFYTQGYTGNITIQASSLPYSPDTSVSSTDWFDVQTHAFSNVSPSTGIFHSNFKSAASWIRVVNAPDDGNVNTLSKVLLRN